VNLSVRQLMTFREVMRSGSISQAARTLGRTQPAVSAMIASLERELGFRLFHREQGKLLPTPEARFFLEEAEEILSRLEQTKRTLAGVASLERGRLRVACHPAASGFFMPRVLTGFLSERPDVEVALMMRSSRVIEELVASQQFDVGFAETPRPRDAISQTDFDLECVCVLAADDALAGKAIISPADLDGADLAMLFSEHETFQQTRKAFDDAGCSFRRRFELQTFLPGLQFVASGMCYMICDMITAHGFLQRGDADMPLVFRPFRPRISSSISILRPAHRPSSALADAFCACISGQIERMRNDIESGRRN